MKKKQKKSIVVHVGDFDSKEMKKVKRTMVKRLKSMKHTGKDKEYAYSRFPRSFVDANW